MWARGDMRAAGSAAPCTACSYLIYEMVFASPRLILPLSDAYHSDIAFKLSWSGLVCFGLLKC